MNSARELVRRVRPETPEALVWWLTVMASIGITAVLPVLPLYASGLGADIGFIGWMMAAYWAANLVCLPIGGWLSDRFGRRPVMIAGLLGYSLASAGFLLIHATWFFVLLRAIEGFAGACFMPSALAYVADRAPKDGQGSHIARLAAAENVGMLIGPMMGGTVASVLGLGSPFICLAVLCALGNLLVVKLPESRCRQQSNARTGSEPERDLWQQVQWGLAVGIALRSLAGGFSFGLYEVVWPLFMRSIGGTVWQITLSWTVFGFPSILLNRQVGRVIDRMGPGRPAVLGAAASVAITLFYPLAEDPWTMIGLSLLEGFGFAFAYPALNALLVQVAPAGLRGRMIGSISTLKTLGAITASLITPSLFAASPPRCFGITAIVLFCGLLALAIAVLRAEQPAPGDALEPVEA